MSRQTVFIQILPGVMMWINPTGKNLANHPLQQIPSKTDIINITRDKFPDYTDYQFLLTNPSSPDDLTRTITLNINDLNQQNQQSHIERRMNPRRDTLSKIPPLNSAGSNKTSAQLLLSPRSRKSNKEFKSFLARIKYMMYMDYPRPPAHPIDPILMSWSLQYTSLSNDKVYIIHRDIGEYDISLFHMQSGQPDSSHMFHIPGKKLHATSQLFEFLATLGWCC